MPLIRKPQAQLENLYLKTIFLFSQLAADKFTLQCLQLVGQVDFHQIRIKETCIFRPECIHLLICIADDFRKYGQRKVPAVFYDGLQQFFHRISACFQLFPAPFRRFRDKGKVAPVLRFFIMESDNVGNHFPRIFFI